MREKGGKEWPVSHLCFTLFSSGTWKSVSDAERQQLTEGQGAKEDGEFFMSFQDFCKHFTDFEMCSVSIDEMVEDENS